MINEKLFTKGNIIERGYSDKEIVRLKEINRRIFEENKRRPNGQDYLDLKNILRNFRIDVEIKDMPIFKSIVEMDNWKNKIIKERLN